MDRRMNTHSLYDRHFDVYERAMTWEGALHHSERMRLAGMAVSEQIHRMCVSVSEHIASVLQPSARVRSIVLFFKIDAHARIWLQYCTYLHVGDNDPPPQPSLTVPSKTVPSPPLTARSYPRAPNRCASCEKFTNENDLFDVTYKTVITHFRGRAQLPPAFENHESRYECVCFVLII